jgi:transposase
VVFAHVAVGAPGCVVRQCAPAAVICLDPFYVVAWAIKALDKVRVRTMSKAGIRDRHAMWATRKTPDSLQSWR